jgi:NAD(P)H-dependent flavin oxidoreductase YrpB (nitropropane dioxygenase family)
MPRQTHLWVPGNIALLPLPAYAPELKATWHAPVLLHLRELDMAIRAHCGSERWMKRILTSGVAGCVVVGWMKLPG